MSYDPNQPMQPSPNEQPQPPYGQSQWGQQPPNEQQTPYEQPQSPYGQSQWGQQPPPPSAPTQYGAPYGTQSAPVYTPSQPRQSRRALWIALGIIGGLLVLSCIVCTIFFALGIGFFARTVGVPTSVVDQYYNAIKDQNYSQAYSYLDPNLTVSNGQPLTRELYTTAAQEQDTSKGRVSSFSISSISVNNGIQSMTISVKRANAAPYDVHLQLRQEGNDWKITAYDAI